MESSLIDINNLSYKNVFQNLNFSIKRGKVYLILGDNGSGKTTLLYLIQGLYRPDIGEIFYCEEAYDYRNRWLSYLRGKVGLLFQNPDYQVIGLTVKDDLGLGLKVNGVDRKKIDEYVDLVLNNYNIFHLKDKRTDLLSFGEKKKVSLAAISLLNPDLSLLDEPYAGLDKSGRQFVDDFIRISKQNDKTVVITSHEPGEFLYYVDEIYFIKDRSLNKIDTLNEDFIPVYMKNILLLSKYGYLDKPLPEDILKDLKK
ncbi:MAG: energy-coupling factor ABC transporter ATP-binding protein [Calditerrivibrio sp.]|nr:energy-coupling factor ABC transporter ATP-binding protein [Calditerrivibrio sp.]